MAKKFKKIFIFVFILFIFFSNAREVFSQQSLEIYFFWGLGCPHCAAEKPFLEKLKKKYPQLVVKDFEVYFNNDNRQLFLDVAKAYNTSASGVPMTFIGDHFILGFATEETTGKEIESLIKKCLIEHCPSPSEILSVGGLDQWEKLKKESNLPSISISPSIRPPIVNSKITIHYFIKENCSDCQEISLFLKEVSQKYNAEVQTYNLDQKENQDLYQKLEEFYHISSSDFPLVFLGDKYLVGSKSIKENIENLILECQLTNCQDRVENIKKTLENFSSASLQEKETINLSLFGRGLKISKGTSLFFLTIILGLVDGINPCMFSVLLFLLTYLFAIGSKRRGLRAGLVFVLGAFITYFSFMVGMISLISVIGFISKIKLIIAIVALIAGVIMIKDFFAYGKGPSLEIPQGMKPLIESLVKKATIVSAFLLALLSSLVELPCTAGIPLVYVSLLAQRSGSHIPFLLLYNFFFVLPLLIIILFVAFAWTKIEKIEKWRLSFRRYMRLLSGIILLLLAIALFKNWL